MKGVLEALGPDPQPSTQAMGVAVESVGTFAQGPGTRRGF